MSGYAKRRKMRRMAARYLARRHQVKSAGVAAQMDQEAFWNSIRVANRLTEEEEKAEEQMRFMADVAQHQREEDEYRSHQRGAAERPDLEQRGE